MRVAGRGALPHHGEWVPRSMSARAPHVDKHRRGARAACHRLTAAYHAVGCMHAHRALGGERFGPAALVTPAISVLVRARHARSARGPRTPSGGTAAHACPGPNSTHARRVRALRWRCVPCAAPRVGVALNEGPADSPHLMQAVRLLCTALRSIPTEARADAAMTGACQGAVHWVRSGVKARFDALRARGLSRLPTRASRCSLHIILAAPARFHGVKPARRSSPAAANVWMPSLPAELKTQQRPRKPRTSATRCVIRMSEAAQRRGVPAQRVDARAVPDATAGASVFRRAANRY